jgi:class 3 adenylate cyclase
MSAESTRKLIGNLFELQDLGAQDLKGIAEPVRAWALRASSVESRFEAFEVCDRWGHLHSSCCNCSLR